ncbi:MAG: aminotransferase class IV [Prolixibacteraceae bacterium]|nr:aminotransferase class IV [Prolixibacteraceae bacterium]
MNKQHIIYKDGDFLNSSQHGNNPRDGITIYEVLRIIEGKPLFFEEHFERLKNSCNKISRTCPVEHSELHQILVELSKMNNQQTGNIKIEVGFENDNHNILIHFIPHAYPTPEMYSNGVKVGFLHAERHQPEIKTDQPEVRNKANQIIKENNLYEVLLVNHEDEITEGSRSNIFFITGNKLITPPLNQVLKGITLCKVLEIARDKNIQVEYKNLKLNELVHAESMFLTGTSPKILPISQSGDYMFNVKHPLLKEISNEYEKVLIEDLRKKPL